jgi:hypothetical protein
VRRLFRDRRPGDDFYISEHIGLEVFVRPFAYTNSDALTAGPRAPCIGTACNSSRPTATSTSTCLKLFKDAEVLAERFADSGAGTLDLIHLASAFQVERSVPNPPVVFVASDRKLKHVVSRAGLNIFDPEHMRLDDLGL